MTHPLHVLLEGLEVEEVLGRLAHLPEQLQRVQRSPRERHCAAVFTAQTESDIRMFICMLNYFILPTTVGVGSLFFFLLLPCLFVCLQQKPHVLWIVLTPKHKSPLGWENHIQRQ